MRYTLLQCNKEVTVQAPASSIRLYCLHLQHIPIFGNSYQQHGFSDPRLQATQIVDHRLSSSSSADTSRSCELITARHSTALSCPTLIYDAKLVRFMSSISLYAQIHPSTYLLRLLAILSSYSVMNDFLVCIRTSVWLRPQAYGAYSSYGTMAPPTYRPSVQRIQS